MDNNLLSNSLYEAWNRADHCTNLLLICGANREEVRAPNAQEMRQLKESASYLAMFVMDIERHSQLN